MLAPDERRQIKAVVRVASGNFLEMYDFSYYARYIAETFFRRARLAAAVSLTGALLSRRLTSAPGLQPAMA